MVIKIHFRFWCAPAETSHSVNRACAEEWLRDQPDLCPRRRALVVAVNFPEKAAPADVEHAGFMFDVRVVVLGEVHEVLHGSDKMV